MRHVRQVLQVLRDAGLTASPRKCVWGGKVVEFLGHKLGDGRVSIPDRRVTALKEYIRPRTKRALRSFLGVVSFYCRYIEMLAKHTAALSPATGKSAPNVGSGLRTGVRPSALYVSWFVMLVFSRFLSHRMNTHW